MHARDGDDAPAPPAVDHVPGGPLDADEGSVQVRAEGAAPGVPVGLHEQGAAVDAGIIDEDVEAAELSRQLVDDVPAGRCIGGVQARDGGRDALRPDEPRGLLGAFLVGVPGDADVASRRREGDGGGAADPRVGAGDDC